MLYEYRSEDGESIVKSFPMNEDHPSVIEENGKSYKRVFGGVLRVPPYMKAENDFKFKYHHTGVDEDKNTD